MAEYQPEMLRDVASRLQYQMRRIIFRTILSHMFLGAVIGIGLWSFGARLSLPLVPKTFPWWSAVPALALVFGVDGYLRGKHKSMTLRYEAQRTLCWVQMEEHLGQLVQLLSTSTEKSKKKKKS